jgi:mannitol/fructose-specific phosphotransferase system IIA component (Ntr-type)
MTLADFTSPGLIRPQLQGPDAASVIQELSQALQHEKRISDWLPFYHAALNHEFLVGSDMEAGLAFPHARLPGLRELAFAVGRSKEPLAWGSKSTRSVRMVFLIAVPATDSTQYLLLVAGLARLAKASQLVETLQAAPVASQMWETLQQIKLPSGQTHDTLKKWRTTRVK